MGDVLRGTQPLHCDPINQRLLPFLSVPSPLPFRCRVGADETRRHGVDGDPEWPQLVRQLSRQPDHRVFVEQYAWMPVSEGPRPPPELMLTIRPLPARFMPAATARLNAKAAPMLTAKTRSQSVSRTSSSDASPSATPPALLTSTSTAPPVVSSICAIHAAAAARSVR